MNGRQETKKIERESDRKIKRYREIQKRERENDRKIEKLKDRWKARTGNL